jgi:hypothetical protein
MRATAADLVGTAGTDASSSNSRGSRHIIVLLEAELRDDLVDPLLKRRDVADIGPENGRWMSGTVSLRITMSPRVTQIAKTCASAALSGSDAVTV